MTMTDTTPPDTDKRSEAVAWVLAERAAGRDPKGPEIAARYGVSPRTGTNWRQKADEHDGGVRADVVPIRGNPAANGNGSAPARPVADPPAATPPAVADDTPAATAPSADRQPRAAATGNGKAPESATATPPATRPATARPAAPVAEPAPAPTPVTAPAGVSDAILRATTVAVLGVAIVAAVVSYEHMRLLAEDAGESWWRAALLPLSVDGLVVVASAVMLTRRRAGRGGGWLAGAALVLGIAASLAANVVSSDPTLAPEHVIRWAVAGWSPLSLAVSFELLLQLRAERAHGSIAGRDGDAAVTPTNRWKDTSVAGETAVGRSQEGGQR